MKKHEIIAEILQHHPDSTIAKEPDPTAQQLRQELRRVKRGEHRVRLVQCTAVYRVEGSQSDDMTESGDKVSYHLVPAQHEGLPAFTRLIWGPMPLIGAKVKIDEEYVAEILWVKEGLEVRAGDLAQREPHDPNRIYSTPKGTRCRFMRVEGEKVVCWSYKTNDEVQVGPTYGPLVPTEAVAASRALKPKRRTQEIVAAWLIANKPDIRAHELTAELEAAFPPPQFKVGKRHGHHYLSKSHTGKLPEPPDMNDDPRKWEL